MTETKRPMAMQRAAALVPLALVLEEHGVSLASVLEGTDVSPHEVRHDAFVPYAAFLSVLDNACRLTGRDDIGMQLGKRQTLAALGPLSGVLRHAATLAEAIGDFAAFQRHNSTGGAVYLMQADRDVILGYGVYDATAPVTNQIYDLVLAVGCNLIAELTGGQVAPEEIVLSMAVPADPTRYIRLANCPVRFGQHQTGVLLRASVLNFPLPAADKGQHDLALAKLLSVRHGTPAPLSAHVRHLLRPFLLMGHAKMANVAERLGMHPRALRRRLRAEETTFEAIRDEVRQVAAKELLRLGDLTIADISATLDYSNPSSFVHAFRRWSGTSPGLWRNESRPDRV
ncbi:MAG: AraC family transcriptional regulator ligand-binding domain-containing protein [Hyphomicrobiales bacterium]|nr:AraC family transcriptional regulator ligand-binding domain-containing protein [Hyphomicrobiales bacterium]